MTIAAVPIVRTGTYELASGTRTFAEEDLVAAAAALATDAGVKAPRIKIDGLGDSFDPEAHGGEPAFGWADNLQVVDNGQTLAADFHVPSWLADAMTWAYPSLSIEGTPPGWISATGRSHELVVTAIAMLGVDWPGVTTLDDLRALLASGPEIEEAAPDGVAVVAAMPQRPRSVVASLDSDLVARRFYDGIDNGDIDPPEGVGRFALWIRSMRFDDGGTPYLKVTDEDSGRLYRVDFTVAGSEVTFGEFVEIVEQDVPVAAGMARPAAPIAAWATRDDARAVIATQQREGLVPLDMSALRTRLGLPEDADEDAINAALAAEVPDPPVPPPVPDPVPPPVTPEVPEGMALVDAETLDTLRTGAEQGVAVAARLDREDRDRIISAAIGQGRFAVGRREHYEQAWERDPDGTRTLLTAEAADGGLARGLVPVTELGSAGDGEEQPEAADAEHERYMARHFPQAHARLHSDSRGVRHRTEV